MQRYFVNEKDEDKFLVNDIDSHHILNVMRMKIGDIVEIVYQEEVYKTKIIKTSPVCLEIIEKLEDNNELPVKVTICQSLVVENKMDFIFQKGCELGAFNFIPFKAVNSIIKGNSKDFAKKNIRWQRIVYDASRQSKRNIVPKVLEPIDINDLIKLNYDLKILCTVNEVSTTLKTFCKIIKTMIL